MKQDTLPKTIKCIWHLQSWGVVFPFQKNSEGKKPRGRRCPAKELASITSCLGSSKSKERWACQQLWVGRCSCQELSTSDPVWASASRPRQCSCRDCAGKPHRLPRHKNIHHLPRGLRGLQRNYLQSYSLDSLWRHSWLVSSSEKCLKQYPQLSFQIFLEVIQDITSNTWLLWRGTYSSV